MPFIVFLMYSLPLYRPLNAPVSALFGKCLSISPSLNSALPSAVEKNCSTHCAAGMPAFIICVSVIVLFLLAVTASMFALSRSFSDFIL